MQKIKVYFIDLSISNKTRHTCDIVEKLYEQGFSVTVFTKDSSQKHTLDRMLWTWKQESFIPHTTEIDPDSDTDEAVLLTEQEDLPVRTDAVVLYDPLPPEKLHKYQLVVDFAEVYDKARLQKSRQRFKQLRDIGEFELEYLKLGEFLGKELAYHPVKQTS